MSERDVRNKQYAEQMATELAKYSVKRPATTVQAASTQAILDGAIKADRPLPTNWKAVSGAKTIDEMVAKRTITVEEFTIETKRRQGSKNTVGQSELTGTSAARKDKAVQGILYTPPAQLTAQEQIKVIQLTPLVEAVPIVVEPVAEPKRDSFWQRLFKRNTKSTMTASLRDYYWQNIRKLK